MWTALVRAHRVEGDADRAILSGLIERYQQAAYRYLTAATGDPDLAAELFQEFAVRFLSGDFRRANPEHGRFRDYLRTALINLVRRRPGVVRAEAGADPAALPASPPEANPDDEEFLSHWRESLLDRAWETLKEAEGKGGPPFFTALRARADNPDLSSEALATALNERGRLNQPLTDAGLRKLLQRARELFTDSVVAEVAASVPTTDRERLAQELIDLGFFGYCKKAWSRWQT